MPNNEENRYQLIWQPAAIQQLQDWKVQAKQQGVTHVFLAKIREMISRLRRDPADFGDVQNDYKNIKASEYRGLIPRWLCVWYGADHAAKVVIIRSLKPAPGSKLF